MKFVLISQSYLMDVSVEKFFATKASRKNIYTFCKFSTQKLLRCFMGFLYRDDELTI